ncbi:hypothetical protein [Stenotrophomonas sp.]|uniref:hypothetical protein n=1 Tax=Stenotrophomonas sp. TaxID=69392 RepID=UPI002FCC32D4
MRRWIKFFGVAALMMSASVNAGDVDPTRHRLHATTDKVEIESYSKASGAPADVAVIELERQTLAQDGIDALREEFNDRLAGLYWTDYPNQAINIRLTGAAFVAPRKIETAAGNVPVVFTLGAPMTLAEQSIRLKRSWPALKAMLPGLIGAGIDERDGSVSIDIRSPVADPKPFEDEKANIEQVLGMPVRFSVHSLETDT